jgi:hypothetical protein
VEVLAHHVPATMDSRLGGIIALESRERSVASKGEVVTTLLASSATAYVPDLPREIDLLASARVTYMDQLHRRVYGAARARGDQIPSYGDALDGHSTWSLEGIGYLARDWTGVNAAEGDIGRSFSERMAGLTLRRAGARTMIQLRISQDQADARVGTEARPDQRTLLGDQRLTSTSVRAEWRFSESLLADLSLSVDQRAHRHEWYRGAAEAVGLPANFRSDRRQVASAAASSVEILLPGGSSLSAGVRLHAVSGGTQVAPRLRYSRPPAVRHAVWRASGWQGATGDLSHRSPARRHLGGCNIRTHDRAISGTMVRAEYDGIRTILQGSHCPRPGQRHAARDQPVVRSDRGA